MPFYNPENQNFEKMKKKKIPGYIIILLMCIINDNRIIYGPWDDKRDWQFLSFYPTNNPNNQNFERMKKSLEIS